MSPVRKPSTVGLRNAMAAPPVQTGGAFSPPRGQFAPPECTTDSNVFESAREIEADLPHIPADLPEIVAEVADLPPIIADRREQETRADLREFEPEHRPRREKPIRFTLDLDRPHHQFLKEYAARIEANGASAVMRALLDELRDDPDLANRVKARIWQS